MPTGERVRDYRELEARVSALPPAAEGRVRVFRGQSRDYPLTPSGRRRQIPRADIWSHYLRQLVFHVEGRGVHKDFESEIQVWMLWVQALAQHYGAGSHYLDVTHDLGIAVWFAFHKSKTATLRSAVGPSDGLTPDTTLVTDWVKLAPFDGPAYVYVLDLPAWSGEGTPGSGEVVDLKKGPPVFISPRIEAQSGCLVWAEEGEDIKALASYEFVVEGGFQQSPYGSWSLEQIFPAPSDDEWYARFLSIPFSLSASESGDAAVMRQSLPVTLYLSSRDSPYVADIRGHLRHLWPARVHSAIHDDARLADATVVVLEGPQVTAHPPLDHPSWNHELLLSDWDETVATFNLETGQPDGVTSLRNVLLEFSPLDAVGWDEATSGMLLRGIWFLWEPPDARSIFLITQDYPSDALNLTGPIHLRLDATRRLSWGGDSDGSQWQDIASFKMFAKAIVSSLVLLRDCSPTPKAAAYPEWEIDQTVYVNVSSAAAHLARVASPNQPTWYVARHPNGEPFTTARPNLGKLRLELTRGFESITADEMRGYLAPRDGGSA